MALLQSLYTKPDAKARLTPEEHPILLAEDNPDDVLITQRAWKKGLIRNKLYVVNNGKEALQFLYKEKPYAEAPTPSIMLLDLMMPKVDGFQVLETIKKDPDKRCMPVIVLTSSSRNDDIDRAYRLGCNSYITKPVYFENFIRAVKDIHKYWLILCEIPH